MRQVCLGSSSGKKKKNALKVASAPNNFFCVEKSAIKFAIGIIQPPSCCCSPACLFVSKNELNKRNIEALNLGMNFIIYF